MSEIPSEKFCPKVSIVIPVYNGSKFLKRAIDSALSQTYKNIEIIVVNDGSNDDGATENIALSYGDKIRYFYKENGGVSTALNFGIENMCGKYLSWLSHDDEYEADKIEREVAALTAVGDKTIIFCSLSLIDENSDTLNATFDFGLNDGEILSPEKAFIKILNRSVVNGCATLIPAELFKYVKFDERHRYVQDFEMWLNACILGYSWKFLDYKGVKSRVHAAQLTNTGKKVFISDCISWAESIAKKVIDFDDNGYKLTFNLAKYFKKYGAKSAAKIIIKQGKNYKRLSLFDRIKLFFMGIYGDIRPLLRKVYYSIFVRKN